MRTSRTKIISIITAVLLIAVFAVTRSSPSQVPADHPQLYVAGESETEQIDHILEQAGLAMDDVLSYRTSDTLVDSENYGEPRLTSESFAEHQSPRHYTFGSTGSPSDPPHYIEWRVIGNQYFIRRSDMVWHEQKPITGPSMSFQLGAASLFHFRQDSMKLASTNEITENGIEVYRIEGTQVYLPEDKGSGQVTDVITETLLIDKETFQFVSRIRAHDYSREPDDSGSPTSWQLVNTTDYQDLNQPVVIDMPTDYVPWAEPVVSN